MGRSSGLVCVLVGKGRVGRCPGGAAGLGSRGEDCVSCWGRTFIKDGCILISVICDGTQSSCGKYVLTGPLRQRCRHVETVGELVGDTAANRLCGRRDVPWGYAGLRGVGVASRGRSHCVEFDRGRTS